MKTFKKTTQMPSFLSPFKYNSIFIMIAFVFLFSITGFVSVNENPPNNIMMPGVVFEIETTDHEQSPPKTAEMEVVVEGRNLKMDILPGEGQRGTGKMIYKEGEDGAGEVVLVDDDEKSYYVIDKAFVNSMKGKINQSKSMVEDAMKNLTKEQREMIEMAQKQSGGSMPGFMKPISKPETTKTSEKGTKSGYPCVKYEVYLDGKKIREIWTTDWSNIDGGGEAEEAFEGMNNFFKSIMEDMGDIPGSTNPYDEMNFENGFPVVVSNFGDDGGLKDESWLKRTRRQTIDPDAFEPPSGYKRRSMLPN